MDSYNINTEDYSIEELLNLLQINNNYPKKNEIISKSNKLINIFDDHDELKTFFITIKNKLLNHYEFKNTYVNSDILKNINNNIETEGYTNYNQQQNDYNNDNDDDNDNNDNDDDNNNDDDDNDDDDNDDDEDNDNIDVDANLSKLHNINKKVYKTSKDLYFNTLFEKKLTDPNTTEYRISLAFPLKKITQVKLLTINIKKPFTISESKFNNKFIIKKYNLDNICDISHTITIDNGYYDNESYLQDFLNNNYFYNSSYTDFLKYITFSINSNSKKITFKLDANYLSIDPSFNYFSIDFHTNYVKYYSLASLLGFNYDQIFEYRSTDISNLIIKSPYEYSIIDEPLFFCFNDHNKHTYETQYLFLDKNTTSKDKVLAKINTTLGTHLTNYYIYQTIDNMDRNDNVRRYDGEYDLQYFDIKIIDSYGLPVVINENFTFELEVLMTEKKLASLN